MICHKVGRSDRSDSATPFQHAGDVRYVKIWSAISNQYQFKLKMRRNEQELGANLFHLFDSCLHTSSVILTTSAVSIG